MNTTITKSIPRGEFSEISIHVPEWQARFLKMVQDEKRIKYDIHTMPNLSKEIQEELSKRGYAGPIPFDRFGNFAQRPASTDCSGGAYPLAASPWGYLPGGDRFDNSRS